MNISDDAAKKSGVLKKIGQFFCDVFLNVRWLLVLYDLILFAVIGTGWILIYRKSLSLDGPISEQVYSLAISYLIIFVVRLLLAVYRQIWRYGGVQSYIRLCAADGISYCAAYLILHLFRFVPVRRVPFVWLISFFSLYLLFSLFMRMLYRYMFKKFNLTSRSGRFFYFVLRVVTFDRIKKELESTNRVNDKQKIRVAIVGAGNTGVSLSGELVNNTESPYVPVLFIDISSEKIGRFIGGLPVISESEATHFTLSEYNIQEIVFALPHLSDEEFERQYLKYSGFGLKVKSYDYPQMNESGRRGRIIREINVEDLLFRQQNILADDITAEYYKGKTVLISGGGGSIGSELCRRLARMNAAHLIILDIYENGAYDIQQELRMEYGDAIEISVEIVSVCCREDLESIFDKYRPEIVLHAAAHKHVPLMEHNCLEAVKNNVFGTKNIVEVAEKYGAGRFIMISTDKAVNPTNVMGATKRICEQIVLTHGRRGGATKFSATRFGNVLGSNGSVIPLFRRQIAKGGPVTITDRRIVRYFMTIPEASQLVLCSGAIANNGELFVLDMGRPVKILDLAENMIRLSGLIPDRDIKIVETGLRPGEKLYEELLIKNESLRKTDNEKIFVEIDSPVTDEELEQKLSILETAVATGDNDAVKAALHRVVETFREPEEVNRTAQDSSELRQAADNAPKIFQITDN